MDDGAVDVRTALADDIARPRQTRHARHVAPPFENAFARSNADRARRFEQREYDVRSDGRSLGTERLNGALARETRKYYGDA